ncbi:MAG: hypothetical protein M1607_01005 [Patescibacteria group bacterium]|nr:hypothetical protein [Patescibacteria group bacterium]
MQRLSPDIKVQLIKRYLAGEEVSQICQQAHISRTAFYKWLKKAEVKGAGEIRLKTASQPHWRQFSEETAQKVINLALQNPNWSTKQISEQLLVSTFYIWKILYKNGLSTQPKRLKALKSSLLIKSSPNTQDISKIDEKTSSDLKCSADKLRLIAQFQQGQSISYLCHQNKLSRTTFYRWLNKYNHASVSDRNIILNTKRPQGTQHWRFVEGAEEAVLALVKQYPELSVKNLSLSLPEHDGKQLLSTFAVFKILQKWNMTTYNRRLNFAQQAIREVEKPLAVPEKKLRPVVLPQLIDNLPKLRYHRQVQLSLLGLLGISLIALGMRYLFTIVTQYNSAGVFLSLIFALIATLATIPLVASFKQHTIQRAWRASFASLLIMANVWLSVATYLPYIKTNPDEQQTPATASLTNHSPPQINQQENLQVNQESILSPVPTPPVINSPNEPASTVLPKLADNNTSYVQIQAQGKISTNSGQPQVLVTPAADLISSAVQTAKQLTNTRQKPSVAKKVYRPNEDMEINLADYNRDPLRVELVNDWGQSVKVDDQIAGDQVKISQPKDFLPGKYTVKVTSQDQLLLEQPVYWGVLAINTNKSIYQEKDLAKLYIGVVDDQGETVCNAKLELGIKDPAGRQTMLSTQNGLIKSSDECGRTSITEQPDYSAAYQTNISGVYNLTLTATTDNGDYTITDAFEVSKNVAFDIEREAPTRIYPPATYQMKINITANEDFSGQVKETLPLQFNVQKDDQFSWLSNKDQSTSLVWNIDLTKGQTKQLVYTFKAPHLSPYLFTFSPLKLTKPDQAQNTEVSSQTTDFNLGSFTVEQTFPIPTSQPNVYQMQARVTVNQETTELIAAVLPAEFTVEDERVSVLDPNSGEKKLLVYMNYQTDDLDNVGLSTLLDGRLVKVIYKVPWQVGQVYFLDLQFNIHDTDPKLIQDYLKLLTVKDTDETVDNQVFDWQALDSSPSYDPDTVVFQEARNWLIASDAVTATKYASTGADAGDGNPSGSTINWSASSGTLSSAINADDSSYAQCSPSDSGGVTQICAYLNATNFGFTTSDIPTGSTIDGVYAEVYRYVNTAARLRDNDVRLIVNGSVAGNNKADTVNNWTNAWVLANYGGETDTWGVSGGISDTYVRQTNFGMAFSIRKITTSSNAYTGQVDYIRMTIYYTTPVTINISGNVYQESASVPYEGVTKWNSCDGSTTNVSLAIGSTDQANVSCSATDGSFAFSTTSIASANMVLTIWLDTGGGDKGVLYTKNNDTTSDITGLKVYKNHVWVQSESSQSITNANINSFDQSNDSDIPIASDGTNVTVDSGVELHINTGDTYAPGGNVTTPKLHIVGTYTGSSETLNLTGSGTSASCDATVADMRPLCIEDNPNTSGSPLAAYKFEEATGQTTVNYGSAGSALDGTLGSTSSSDANDPTWTSGGKYREGLSFDGGDFVNLGTDASLDFSGNQAFSISAWIKPGSSTDGYIVSKYNSGQTGQYILSVSSGKLVFHREVSPWFVTGNTTLQTGNWYYVVGVYDGTNLNIYLNGSSDATPIASGSVSSDSQPVYIGAGQSNNSPANFFNGIIDQVTIYNYALSSADVSLGYGLGSGTFTATSDIVNYTGSAASTVEGTSYYDLGVGTTSDSGSGVTYTLGGNTDVADILTVGNDSSTNSDTLAGSSYILTLSGGGTPFMITSKGAFSAGTSTVIYTGSGGSTTLNLQVGYAEDDAYQADGGTAYVADLDDGSSAIGTGNTASTPHRAYGARFRGVTIPQGATITSASLKVRQRATEWMNVLGTWYGQAADNASAFSAGENMTSRAYTSASVAISQNISRTAGTWYGYPTTGDWSAIVQEIVDRPGWQSGNSMVFIADGNGATSYASTQVSTHGNGSAYGATLDVTYESGTAVTAATYYNLEVSPNVNSSTQVLGTGASQAFVVNNNLTVGDGTHTSTLDVNSNDPTLSIAGNIIISANATYSASSSTSSSALVIGDNLTNNGTFTANSGAVTFNNNANVSTLTYAAATTFANFNVTIASKEINFDNAHQTNITGTFTVDGGDCATPVKLYSDSSGNQFEINATGTNSLGYADIKDSYAVAAITANNSVNSGNNGGSWTINTGSCFANQNPNSPTSLSQAKTDDTSITTGQWINQSSVKFSAQATDPDSSDTLYLCVEKKGVGGSFIDSEDSCGSGVAYSGSAVTLSVTISGITDATQYHWHARVKDTAGAYSSWVSYGGNTEAEADFGIDTTAPTGGTVYDGTNSGVDQSFNDSSLSQLAANWDGVDANASGLNYYEYSIGTTVGGTDVKSWTSNSTNTSVTVSGLSLQTSQVYYFNVRAIDNAGNTQTAISSDGQIVAPTLVFSVTPATITFDNLNSGNSYSGSKQTTLTTSTNAYNGYVIRSFTTDLLKSASNPSLSIGNFNGGSYASPDAWQSGDRGFGYHSSDTLIQGVNKFNGSPCPGGNNGDCFAPFSQTAPGDIVADHTTNVTGSPLSDEQFTITYQVKTDATQAAADYATVVVYTINAQY